MGVMEEMADQEEMEEQEDTAELEVGPVVATTDRATPLLDLQRAARLGKQAHMGTVQATTTLILPCTEHTPTGTLTRQWKTFISIDHLKKHFYLEIGMRDFRVSQDQRQMDF